MAVGRTLHAESIRRLMLAHMAGWSYDKLAELYNELKLQIESADPAWRASRLACSDGSHVFVGTYAQALAIMPDRSVHLGTFGATSSVALVFCVGMSRSPNGAIVYPPPNPAAPGTTRIC
jgi:hypothetical protein